MKLNIHDEMYTSFIVESFAVFNMEIPKEVTPNTYISIQDETAMVNEGLTTAAIRTYKYLCEVADNRTIATTADIAEYLGLALRTTQKACKALVDKGYMYDHRFTTKRHKFCVRFLGKDPVRNARLKAAVIGLMMDRKLDGNQMAEWVSTNKEDYLKALTRTNELSIYFKE